MGGPGLDLDLDPHLRQLLLEEAEREPVVRRRRVGVIARLRGAQVEVPGLDVVVRAGTVVTGRTDVAALPALRRHPDVLSLKRTHRYLPHDAVTVPGATVADRPGDRDAREPAAADRPWTGRGVVVGMLDWGFDPAHVDLLDADGRSRFLALWDQRGGRTPLSPAAYGYGRVLDAAALDAALATPDPYAALGYDPADVDPFGQGTHGTHTLGIACGTGRSGAPRGLAPDAAILAVHLRGDDTAPHDTLGDSVRILEGVDWVFRTAGDRPVVLNMSLGRCGGPHDASPLVVRALDTMLEVPGRQIVCSAGNYYATGQHTSAQLREGVPVTWGWHVEAPLVDDAELEIWYPAADEVTVELLAPGGAVVRLAAGEARVLRDDGRVVVSGFHRRADPATGDGVVDLFLWPGAPAGTWRVRLLPDRVQDGEVHGWIERVHRGRQSRFTDPDPLFTTNTLCNGRRTLAVAAYDHRAPVPVPGAFSSAGPARDLHPKPDLAAPGVAITAARSAVLLNGRRERDGTTTMTGTSMAAPHVSAAVAVLFEAAGRPLAAAEVGDLLRSTARPCPLGTDRVGRGLLDVDAALAALAARPGTPVTPAGGPATDDGRTR
ncbi:MULTISPECIES: S8 family serine peptidase [unclassified Actinotalea]|uniref:S8 family serine peptidase n=1 Tax=unclassified Actinotalea TaxID=2638618 RepID=UPI0015F6E293|nr:MULTISPECIES: S8 family serine peptidase [unclassified Actinotalea]